jgi:hypothetical protein
MAYTTIDKPSNYFDTKLYTGDGTTNQTITGINFKPDFNWIKLRSSAHQHTLTDAVRGLNKGLLSNSTQAENTDYQYGWLSSFNSDGFTTQKGSGIAYNVNQSGETYVSWNWLGANTTASNTAGSITSTVSANTTSGFSIVSYTGTGANASIGHGLGSTPAMIICKSRSDAEEWATYHQSLGTTKYIVLNSTAGANSTARFYQAPTSSLFYVDNGYGVNKSSATYIAYCFAEVKGYSKFGKFISNNSDNGTFTYCGFKPAWVMMKPNVSDGWSHWYIFDNKRDLHNLTDLNLQANLSDADNYGGANYAQIDMLSNGFKIRRDQNWGLGGSGTEVIYMAFAENPFVSSTGIPTTAR